MDPIVAVRFVHYAAAMLLFGASAFETVLAPPSLPPALPRPRLWALPLALVLLLTALLWLLGEAADIGNGWSDATDLDLLGSVLTATPFGGAWLVHLGLALLLVVACLTDGPIAAPLRLVLVALLLMSLALVGHAAIDEGIIGLAHRGNDMLHLLAAGLWVGALPPLLYDLALLRRPDSAEAARQALSKFSGLGHVAVAVVLLTGIVNAMLILHHFPDDFGSPYQLLLLIKIGLVLVMVGIALANRYWVTPGLIEHTSSATRALVIGTVCEIALGAVVIALVSAFGTFDPV